MTTSSRRALLGAGPAGGAGLLAGCSTGEAPQRPAVTATSSTATTTATVDFDPQDRASVRAQFPLATDRAQFAARRRRTPVARRASSRSPTAPRWASP